MNKTDLVNVIASESEMSKKDIESVVNAAFDAISAALKSGDKVQLIGFGTFEVKDVAAREGHNPSTGDPIKIEASKRISFSASKVLKSTVNE